MTADWRRRGAAATGHEGVSTTPLSGGCISTVYRIDLANGERVVAKLGSTNGNLSLEGWMLDFLIRSSDLPVPNLCLAEDDLLVMSYLPTNGSLDANAQGHAAELLAALHNLDAPNYGCERDTLIGGLHQPNPASPKWVPFFAEHRLLYMGNEAYHAGRLPAPTLVRVENLSSRLEKWLEEPAAPSLIHGDLWGGNVLCQATPDGNRISGFVDPAIYFADAEIELAFSTLFSTFGDPFFGRYRELRPLRPGFFEERRDLYNLYPLLTHVRLFGGSYLTQVETTLSRFGV